MNDSPLSTAEKEKRIRDIGSPWTDIMAGLQFHRMLTEHEKENGDFIDAIKQAKEDYYSHALSVVLECASKQP